MRRLYVILDNKADLVIAGPFMLPNNIVAARSFAATVNQQEDLKNSPDDYDCRYIGNIDETTGQISPENIEIICTARDFTAPRSTDQLNLLS